MSETTISNMTELLDDLISKLDAEVTAGNLSAKTVEKGYMDKPDKIALDEYPFVLLNDGGEGPEDSGATESQTRIYRAIFEIGAYDDTQAGALDSCLELYNELKDVLEKESNRVVDGMNFAVTVNTFIWADKEMFFHGRQFVSEFPILEDTIQKY